MVSWTLIPICLLTALIGLLVFRRVLMLFDNDSDAADARLLHRAVHASGDGLLVASVVAMVGLVALG